MADRATSDDHLLGGRVRYTQPNIGFRTGLEPVLLAASIGARAGQSVLEGGTGAGAGVLCLAARVSGLSLTGVEIDGMLAELAARNAAANVRPNITIIHAPLEQADLPGPYDHAFANPPYHTAGGTASRDPLRDVAKRGSDALVTAWITHLTRPLRHHGRLTLIVPPGLVAVCLAAMAVNHTAGTALFPLWPLAGRPAKLVLLRGMKNARARLRVLPGLVLHRPDGQFTADAEAILRNAGPIDLETR